MSCTQEPRAPSPTETGSSPQPRPWKRNWHSVTVVSGAERVAVSGRLSYGLREDLRLFVTAVRAKVFASLSAMISLVLDSSFLDCWTISASFAFTRLVISRLSPVLGMCTPHAIDIEQFARVVDAIPSAPDVRRAF